MTLNRYPFQAAQFVRGELSNFFDSFLENGRRPMVWPTLNVWEQGDALYAEAELPGMKMEDIEVTVLGDQLTIKGNRTSETAQEGTYHRRERSVGEFQRTIKLPTEINSAGVEATLKDGVLTVKLPKAPQVQPRKIEVRSV